MRPETKALYPDNWPEISQMCIERANHICQDCGRSDHLGDIILTSHHEDYDPSNSAPRNLICLCQGCHLRRQARDLSQVIIYQQVALLIRMGQRYFPGMKPKLPKRLTRVIEGKALATSPRRGRHGVSPRPPLRKEKKRRDKRRGEERDNSPGYANSLDK